MWIKHVTLVPLTCEFKTDFKIICSGLQTLAGQGMVEKFQSLQTLPNLQNLQNLQHLPNLQNLQNLEDEEEEDEEPHEDRVRIKFVHRQFWKKNGGYYSSI